MTAKKSKIIRTLIFLFILIDKFKANQNLTYHVPEESNTGYFVGNVLTDSKLSFENEKFEVTTIKDDLFRVDKKSGKILVAKRIDRETICPHLSGLLDEVLSDKCKIDFSIHISGTWINVYIIIDDINDNVPEFLSDHEKITISEDSSENQIFPLKLARDLDFGRNTIKSYELDSELSKIFTLKVNLPEEIILILKEKLDAEKIQEYNGQLTACDQGYPNKECSTQKLTIIVKDSNDNSPIFERSLYEVTVKESIRINSPVIQVKALDEDQGNNGKIRYFIKSKSDLVTGNFATDKTFYIDPNSGEIFLRSTLNAKLRREYDFLVFASDLGEVPKKSSVRVVIKVIDENDHRPWIRMMGTQDTGSNNETNTFTQAENSPVDSVIGFLKVGDEDLDENARVDCFISENEEYFSFYMSNPANRFYDIRNKIEFDRESGIGKNGLIPLMIKCTDHGSPPLSSENRFFVAITDIDEHRPFYSDEDKIINLRLEENLPRGRFVFKSNVIDKDATKNVVYKIGNDPGNIFSIDEMTGQVSVQGLLDREEQNQISFNVYACEKDQEMHQVDPMAVQTVNVEILDMNDNKPELIELTEFVILENSLAYSKILGKITVQDLDEGVNGTVKFKVGEILPVGQSMVDPQEIRKRFEIDINTGEIKCTQKLDREEIDEYIIRIEMYDIGIPSMSNSGKIKIRVLDENDNPPEWEPVSIVPFISSYSSISLEEWNKKYKSRNVSQFKGIHNLGIFNVSASLLPGQKVLQLFGKDRDDRNNLNLTFSLLNIDRIDNYDLRFLSDHNVNIQNQKEIKSFYLSFFELNPKKGELTVSSGPDSKGIDFGGVYDIKVSINDNGIPSKETLGQIYLQIMPPIERPRSFSAYNYLFASSSLSFNLIIVMIALTCLVSVCLLAAIFIVRKNASKESFIRGNRISSLQNGIIANKMEGAYSPSQNTLGNLSTVHKWAADSLYLQNDPIISKNGYLSPCSLKTGYTTANSTYADNYGQFELSKQSNLNSNSSGSDNGVYFNINSPLIGQQQYPNTENASLMRNTDSPSAHLHHHSHNQQANLRSFY